MAIKSRWKGAHEKFPAHVEEAKNTDGNVHRGYSLLEFRVAAELLRVGPVHSAEDYWAPSDWQLLLVVSEYMSALLEFLDWFWPDLSWEQHKQAIVLSKRLLQPRSPHTYPELQIEPQLRAAWQSFTYCFWHGTRQLPAAPPPGDPPAAIYSAAREWLTKLVGERGFEAEGHIVASLQSWIQSTRPRLQEAFPNVDWSRWPSVLWPDPECAYRGVEKRGAVKRRQQEEDYAVRWPLRVTQGRPKFNHMKLEARDGFVVGIPPVKNPPALGFLAVSDIMCAFKQAAQHWPSTQPASPSYLAQQEVVQSFVQNVLRETRGPLAPGIAHEKYRYLGYVACSVLGWNSALAHLAVPLSETSAWGPQPLALPGSAAVLMSMLQHQQHHQHHQHQHQHQQLFNAQHGLGYGMGGMAMRCLDPGICVDLGIAAQLAMQPELLLGPDTEAVLAMHLAPPPPLLPPQQQQQPQQQPLAAGASTAARAAACMAGAALGFGSVPLPQPQPATDGAAPRLTGQSSAPLAAAGVKPATLPRPSPFSRAGTSAGAGAAPRATSPPEAAQQQQQQLGAQAQEDPQQQQQPQRGTGGEGEDEGEVARRMQGAEALEGGPAAMSLGGLSSMQDLIDGLPSQTDLTWSAILGTEAGGGEAGGGGGAGGPGPTGTAADALASLPSLLLPSWMGLRPPPQLSQQQQPQPQSQPQPQPQPQQHPQPQSQPQPQPHPRKLQEHTGGVVPLPGPPTLRPGLQPFHSGLPYSGLLQPPPQQQRRLSPDAPVHVQPPSRAASPCQATITTGSLPSLVLPSLAGLPSLGLPSAGLSRPELSGTDPRFARRSHGEVFTLSPMTSCERPNGETLPCTPAPAAAAAEAAAGAAVAAAAELSQPSMVALASLDFMTSAVLASSMGMAAAAGLDGAGAAGPAAGGAGLSGDGLARDTGAPLAALPTGGRRTRRDVAAAAAVAAADEGLAPAPGSVVERCAKRPHAQSDSRGAGAGVVTAATAERVESLGAFLTDTAAGLEAGGPAGRPQQPAAAGDPPPVAAAAARSGSHALSTSVFACSGGTAAAAAAAAAEASADATARQAQLRERLSELLRCADQVAAQLALRDPQAAAGQVLQAMRETDVLGQLVFGCVMPCAPQASSFGAS